MMNEVETLLSSEGVRKMFERSVEFELDVLWTSNYYIPDRRGWWYLLSAAVGEDFLKDSPWETYEEFLEADKDELMDWIFDSYPQIKNRKKMWKYYGEDRIKNRYEYFTTQNNVKEFFEFLEDSGQIERLFERVRITIKKVFGLHYRNRLSKAANHMFSAMISGTFTEDEIVKYSVFWYDYKFNTTNFNCQYNLDLACKIVDNTLSDAEKAEVIAIFNDIKERLIAA